MGIMTWTFFESEDVQVRGPLANIVVGVTTALHQFGIEVGAGYPLGAAG